MKVVGKLLQNELQMIHNNFLNSIRKIEKPYKDNTKHA